MDTRRVARIRYQAAGGSARVGSGLLVGNQWVLTADHVADGYDHHVECGGRRFPVTDMVRSGTDKVDLALLKLAGPTIGGGRIWYARVDRRQVDRISGCVAVGFPRWNITGRRRVAAQVEGSIPTADGIDPAARRGFQEGFLTLVGDRVPPGAPPIPDEERAFAPASPWGGMSGAAVVAGDLVVGVVRSHNLAKGGQSLTVTPLAAVELLSPVKRQQFCDALGIGGVAELPVLPPPGEAAGGQPTMTLSEDVRDAYQATLAKALPQADLPVDWTFAELSGLCRKVDRVSRAADDLTALRDALAAKPAFLAVGGGGRGLGLGQLKILYCREVGGWPEGTCADALLVEAASAAIVERRERPGLLLLPLVRFVTGVAAASGISPGSSALMADWISSLGHQMADVEAYYSCRREIPAWLIINLGNEPRDDTVPWRTSVTWTLVSEDGVVPGVAPGDPGAIECETTDSELREALAKVMRLVPDGQPLLVDLIVPRALMDRGIEHWPIMAMDGVGRSLSAECHPRFRWSPRLHEGLLRHKLAERTGPLVSWAGEAREWLRNDPGRACFIGGHDGQAQPDPLRPLLRDGCGFVIWFPSGLRRPISQKIAKAIRSVPVESRRYALPDHVPPVRGNFPAFIWDDPNGRGGFPLPPLAASESHQAPTSY